MAEFAPPSKCTSGSRIVQLRSGSLFQSKGGLSLPIEICLKIVEDVVLADPRGGSWAVMSAARNFYTLLHKFEHSIVQSVSINDGTNARYPTILLSSWPRRILIITRSYPWLCEVRCRSHTIESLLQHAVTDMARGRPAIDLPVPDVPECEMPIRIERFKRDALHLLYGMADSGASTNNKYIDQARSQQRIYLKSLTKAELATLGVFVRLLGVGFFRFIKKSHPNKTNDSIRDRWIVFEDRLLRYGPFFAYASTTIAQTERKIRDWSNEVIAQALKDMEIFETGQKGGYASLQSILWRLFCEKVKCDMFNSWDEAKEIVEEEMANYDVE